AVDRDTYALDVDAFRLRRLVEADEERIAEQVGVAVELRGFEHDVAVRYIDQMLDAEQQEEPLADAGGEVLLDLSLRQHPVVNGDEPYHAGPRPVAGDLVAEHERERVVPVGQRAAGSGFLRDEHPVDVNPPALDRI